MTNPQRPSDRLVKKASELHAANKYDLNTARWISLLAYLDEREEQLHPIARVHPAPTSSPSEDNAPSRIQEAIASRYAAGDDPWPTLGAEFGLSPMDIHSAIRATLGYLLTEHPKLTEERDTLKARVRELEAELIAAGDIVSRQNADLLDLHERNHADGWVKYRTPSDRHQLITEINRLNAELYTLKTQQPYRDEEMRQQGRTERDGEVAELRRDLAWEKAWDLHRKEAMGAVVEAARALRDGPGLGGDLGNALSDALSALDHEPSDPLAISLQSAKPQP